jgi:hypothetical protein
MPAAHCCVCARSARARAHRLAPPARGERARRGDAARARVGDATRDPRSMWVGDLRAGRAQCSRAGRLPGWRAGMPPRDKQGAGRKDGGAGDANVTKSRYTGRPAGIRARTLCHQRRAVGRGVTRRGPTPCWWATRARGAARCPGQTCRWGVHARHSWSAVHLPVSSRHPTAPTATFRNSRRHLLHIAMCTGHGTRVHTMLDLQRSSTPTHTNGSAQLCLRVLYLFIIWRFCMRVVWESVL